MGRWLDLARELQSDKICADNSDKRDNSEADGPHRRFVGAFVPIVTNVTEVDVVNWINANPPSSTQRHLLCMDLQMGGNNASNLLFQHGRRQPPGCWVFGSRDQSVRDIISMSPIVLCRGAGREPITGLIKQLADQDRLSGDVSFYISSRPAAGG